MDWTKVCNITSAGNKLVSDLLGRVFWFDATKVYYYDEAFDTCGVQADLSGYIDTCGAFPQYWKITDIAYHNGGVYAAVGSCIDGNSDKRTVRIILLDPYTPGSTVMRVDTHSGLGMPGGKEVRKIDDGKSVAAEAKLTSWGGKLWLAIDCYNSYIIDLWLDPNYEPNTWMVYADWGSGFTENLQYYRDTDGVNPWQAHTPYFCMQPNELYVKYQYFSQRVFLYSRVDGVWTKQTDVDWFALTGKRLRRIQCAHLGEIHTRDPSSGALLKKTPDYGANWSDVWPGGYGDHARITGYPDGLTKLGALVGGDDKIRFYVATLDYHNLTDNIRPHNFAHTAHSQFFIDNQNGHVWTRCESAGPSICIPPITHCLDIDVSDRHLYVSGQDVLGGTPLVVQIPCEGVPDTAYGLIAGTSGWAGVRAAGFYECYGYGRFGRNAQVILANNVDFLLPDTSVLSSGLPSYSSITALDHQGHLDALHAYGTTFTAPSLYTNTNTRVNNWVHSSNLPWTARSLHWLLDLEMNSRLIIGCSGVQASPVYYNVMGSGWVASTGLPTTVITDIDSFD